MNKFIKKTILALSLILAVSAVSACEKEGELKTGETVNFKITLTDGREMTGELYPDIAPISVENFIGLCDENFYDGLIFHRVIEGFMIQGGGYDETFYEGNFTSKDAEEIKGEFSANGVKNDLLHTRGVLSMARTSIPDSASSQFFIMHEDYPSLDGQYAAFGKITGGLEIVDEIASSKTTMLEGKVLAGGLEHETVMQDIPTEPIVIESIDIIRNEE